MMVLAAGCSDGSRGKGGGPGGGGPGGMMPGGMTPASKVSQVVIANGAPQDAPNQFGGANSPSMAASLVYPPDGVLIPPNLSILEFQFTPAGGATLFELAIKSTYLDLKIYTTCVAVGGGCALLPDEATWKLIQSQVRSDTATITLRSTGGAGGVGTSTAQKLSFADEDLLGGLYYWAAANGAINRYDFGLRGQKAENFYTATSAGAQCVGCHVLSRDGTRIAVGMNVPGPASLRVLDVATRKTLFESASAIFGGAGGSNFEAISPDATKVLVNSGSGLAMEDAATGMSMNAMLANANMPDWSADGGQIVFARSGGSGCPAGLCGAQPGVDGASLYLVPVTSSGFGTETALVSASGNNNYYPSFSPDGLFVAFNRAAGNSYDAPDAKVLVVATSNGSSPIDLPQVNAIAGNSWPKFAPFVQHFQGKRIFWLTFSSRRDYGLRLQQNTLQNKIAQIWMVAFAPDPNETGYTTYPPFWLPFQDMATGNHIAQWTQKVARQPCTPGPDAGCQSNEVCMNGECVPNMIQ